MDKYLLQAVTLITVAIATVSAAIMVAFAPPTPSMGQELVDLAEWQEEVLLIAEQDREHLHRNGAFSK
jgi:hypothetical protein